MRQQQELFAKAREEQAAAEQAQWYTIQAAAVQQSAEQTMKIKQNIDYDEDDDDY